MLYLLFAATVLLSAAVMSLLFKTPARKFVLAGLDRLKRGRGPVIVKTVAATVFAILANSIYSAIMIRKRWIKNGNVNPTDQVLMSNHVLEASLLGFFLLLALLADRLHYYIRQLRAFRMTMEAVEKNQVNIVGPEEIKAREEQVDTFKEIVKQLQSELDGKAGEAAAAKSKVEDLGKTTKAKEEQVGSISNTVKHLETELDGKAKQVEDLGKKTEGKNFEYDRLLAENKVLRAQLLSLNQGV